MFHLFIYFFFCINKKSPLISFIKRPAHAWFPNSQKFRPMGENASIKKKQKNDNNNFDWNNILSARDKSNRIHKKNTFDDSKANHQNMPRKNVSRAKMKRGIVLPLNGKWFWAVSHFFFSGARFLFIHFRSLFCQSVLFSVCDWSQKCTTMRRMNTTRLILLSLQMCFMCIGCRIWFSECICIR